MRCEQRRGMLMLFPSERQDFIPNPCVVDALIYTPLDRSASLCVLSKDIVDTPPTRRATFAQDLLRTNANLLVDKLKDVRFHDFPPCDVGIDLEAMKTVQGTQPYRLSPTVTSKLLPQVMDLVEAGLISPTRSTRPAIRAIALKKGANDIRLALDSTPYKQACRLLPQFSLQSESTLRAIPASMKVFAKIDLPKAFWSVKADLEQSKHQLVWLPSFTKEQAQEYRTTGAVKTALCSMIKYQVHSMLIGSLNGTTIMQGRLADVINSANLPSSVFIHHHVDDIIVAAPDQAALETTMTKLFNSFQKYNILVSAFKLVMGSSQIEALSFSMTDRGLLSASKAYVRNLPHEPSNKQVLTLTQSLAYFQSLIPRFSLKTAMIRDLGNSTTQARLKAPASSIEVAYDLLKDLDQASVSRAEIGEDLLLITDFSKTGQAAILTNSKKQPMAFYSRRNQPAEGCLSSPDGELCCAISALEQLLPFVLGHHITWITDSAACVAAISKMLTQGGHTSPFIARRLAKIQEYNLSIQHMSGASIPADFLSRFSTSDTDGELYCHSLSASMESASKLHSITHQAPVKLRANLLARGIKISNSDCRRIVANCESCQQTGSTVCRTEGLIKQLDPALQRTGGAFAFDSGQAGNLSFTVAIDLWTRHIRTIFYAGKPVSKQAADLLLLILQDATPGLIVSDGGPEFKGMFSAVLQKQRIDHHLTTPGNSRSNGHAENAVKIVKTRLRRSGVPEVLHTINEHLPELLKAYHDETNSATHHSPNFIKANFPSVQQVPEDKRWASRPMDKVDQNIFVGSEVYCLKGQRLPKSIGYGIDIKRYYAPGKFTVLDIQGGRVLVMQAGNVKWMSVTRLRLPAIQLKLDDTHGEPIEEESDVTSDKETHGDNNLMAMETETELLSPVPAEGAMENLHSVQSHTIALHPEISKELKIPKHIKITKQSKTTINKPIESIPEAMEAPCCPFKNHKFHNVQDSTTCCQILQRLCHHDTNR